MILPRRKFLAGLAATMAMPAIVRVESLMKLPRPERIPIDWRVPIFSLEPATGSILDRIGVMWGIPRYPFESDDNLRTRIVNRIIFEDFFHHAASQ